MMHRLVAAHAGLLLCARRGRGASPNCICCTRQYGCCPTACLVIRPHQTGPCQRSVRSRPPLTPLSYLVRHRQECITADRGGCNPSHRMRVTDDFPLCILARPIYACQPLAACRRHRRVSVRHGRRAAVPAPAPALQIQSPSLEPQETICAALHGHSCHVNKRRSNSAPDYEQVVMHTAAPVISPSASSVCSVSWPASSFA
jgi:hypothetical protein